MYNNQKEIWIGTGYKKGHGHRRNGIMAFSNCGRIIRLTGVIEESNIHTKITINRITKHLYRYIADYFIPKTEEDILKDRKCIDHITHNPVGMNINDVRNLRWCTHKENSNFDECKQNMIKSHLGKTPSNKGKKMSEEQREKLRNRSEFSKKFREHFSYDIITDYKEYGKEYAWYKRYGKCRWEK